MLLHTVPMISCRVGSLADLTLVRALTEGLLFAVAAGFASASYHCFNQIGVRHTGRTKDVGDIHSRR